MKKFFTAFFVVSLLMLFFVPFSASAASSNGYTYSVSDGKAKIIDYTGTATELTIPSSLGGYSVTSIGNSAFYNCSDLTSIVVPDSVTSIGNSAFYNCSSLTSITIPEDVTSIGNSAFYNCSSLTSITIPDNVTSVGEHTFYNCSSLTLITIPEDVTSIGNYAFYNCSSLTSIEIPDSVTSIGNRVFYGCSSLTSVAIPENVTSIEDYTFSYCSSLTSVTIPDSVTSIGRSAFWHCESLTSITIPDNVTSIEDYTFSYCNSLTSITIPDSVTGIGMSAFSGCNNLFFVQMPEEVSIGALAFTGTPYDGYAFTYGDLKYKFDNTTGAVSVSGYVGAPTELLIPAEINPVEGITLPVTSIGNSAFSGCNSLTSITIPDSVTSIGNSAFSGCGSLFFVQLPEGVTIGASAFYNTPYSGTEFTCGDLKYKFDKTTGSVSVTGYVGTPASVIIPSEITPAEGVILPVTSIGSSAFSGCSSLTSVGDLSSVTSIGEWAFYNCSSLTSFEIPDSVTSIGGYAFCNCSSLLLFRLSEGVTIGNNAFLNTPYNGTAFAYEGLKYKYNNKTGEVTVSGYVGSPTEVVIPSEITPMEEVAFPVTSVEACSFSGCSSLFLVQLPDGISIGDNAFSDTPYSGAVFTLEQLKYKYDNVTGEVAVAGYCKSPQTITIPSSIEPSEGVSFPVTSIEDSAFSSCRSLSSIIIPNSVMRIGVGAFSNCISLTSIEIPESVTRIGGGAFSDCTGLASITVPARLTSIENYTFYNCTSLTSIVIPDSVISLGNWTFYNCINLTSISIPNGVTCIEEYAFEGCSSLTSVTIPDGVTSIGMFAFAGCNGLTSVTIPDSVLNIGNAAFCDCTNLFFVQLPNGISIGTSVFLNTPYNGLEFANGDFKYKFDKTIDAVSVVGYVGTPTEVMIPSNVTPAEGITFPVTSIGDSVFYNCTSLTSIVIPDSVKSIGRQAFLNCNNLASVTISNSVTSIGSYAFYKCNSLVSIIIPNSVTILEDSVFRDCIGLTSIMIPDSVISIGSAAFWGCTGLTSVVVPESVTSIGDSAFALCNRIISFTIPDSVTGIGNSAFAYCTGLSSIIIPDNVVSIGSSAFKGCTGLNSIIVPDSVTSIGSGAFDRSVLIQCNYGTCALGYARNNGNPYYVFTDDPQITSQPTAQSPFIGETVILTVAATGTELTYQWQVSKNGGENWSNSTASGNKTNTLSFTAAASHNGYLYRCVIKDINETPVTSEPAKLTITSQITSQPKAQSPVVGGTAKFAVTATGAGLTYQWQYSKDGGSTWVNCSSTGYNKATFSFSATAGLNGRMYRCVIKDANGKQLTSSAVKLTITPKITAQPKAASANVGGTAKFAVTATGAGLKYQWQYSKDGGSTWVNCSSTGYNKATFSFAATAGLNGRMYRCVIKDANGKQLTSSAVKLTITPKITAQPAAVSVTAGNTASFTVKATGAGLKYQWQVSKDSGLTYVNVASTGYNKATFSLKTTKAMNGYRFRCIITDANGKKLTSSAAKLTVK